MRSVSEDRVGIKFSLYIEVIFCAPTVEHGKKKSHISEWILVLGFPGKSIELKFHLEIKNLEPPGHK